MKAIINGVRFDTDKATLIGEAYGGGQSRRDFGYWEAGLYVSPRSKRYFLAGEGGPATMFRRTVGQNAWQGGEMVIPMDKDDALAWAERNLPADVVEAYFGDSIEDA